MQIEGLEGPKELEPAQQNATVNNLIKDIVQSWTEINSESGSGEINTRGLVAKLEAQSENSPLMMKLGELVKRKIDFPGSRKELSVEIVEILKKEGFI
jgi:hypothetical protein